MRIGEVYGFLKTANVEKIREELLKVARKYNLDIEKVRILKGKSKCAEINCAYLESGCREKDCKKY